MGGEGSPCICTLLAAAPVHFPAVTLLFRAPGEVNQLSKPTETNPRKRSREFSAGSAQQVPPLGRGRGQGMYLGENA